MTSSAVQDYYHAMGAIDEMKAQIQFPKLEPPPTDFLHQMEEYCREAPRALDPAGPPDQAQGSKKVWLHLPAPTCPGRPKCQM